MKQTAVEWFLIEFNNLIREDELTEMKPGEFNIKRSKIIEQAKEMFEKQIVDAVTFGQNNHTVMIPADLEIAEQYYNETYNEQ
jgi:hypothetical protein